MFSSQIFLSAGDISKKKADAMGMPKNFFSLGGGLAFFYCPLIGGGKGKSQGRGRGKGAKTRKALSLKREKRGKKGREKEESTYAASRFLFNAFAQED